MTVAENLVLVGSRCTVVEFLSSFGLVVVSLAALADRAAGVVGRCESLQ